MDGDGTQYPHTYEYDYHCHPASPLRRTLSDPSRLVHTHEDAANGWISAM